MEKNSSSTSNASSLVIESICSSAACDSMMNNCNVCKNKGVGKGKSRKRMSCKECTDLAEGSRALAEGLLQLEGEGEAAAVPQFRSSLRLIDVLKIYVIFQKFLEILGEGVMCKLLQLSWEYYNDLHELVAKEQVFNFMRPSILGTLKRPLKRSLKSVFLSEGSSYKLLTLFNHLYLVVVSEVEVSIVTYCCGDDSSLERTKQTAPFPLEYNRREMRGDSAICLFRDLIIVGSHYLIAEQNGDVSAPFVIETLHEANRMCRVIHDKLVVLSAFNVVHIFSYRNQRPINERTIECPVDPLHTRDGMFFSADCISESDVLGSWTFENDFINVFYALPIGSGAVRCLKYNSVTWMGNDWALRDERGVLSDYTREKHRYDQQCFGVGSAHPYDVFIFTQFKPSACDTIIAVHVTGNYGGVQVLEISKDLTLLKNFLVSGCQPMGHSFAPWYLEYRQFAIHDDIVHVGAAFRPVVDMKVKSLVGMILFDVRNDVRSTMTPVGYTSHTTRKNVCRNMFKVLGKHVIVFQERKSFAGTHRMTVWKKEVRDPLKLFLCPSSALKNLALKSNYKAFGYLPEVVSNDKGFYMAAELLRPGVVDFVRLTDDWRNVLESKRTKRIMVSVIELN